MIEEHGEWASCLSAEFFLWLKEASDAALCRALVDESHAYAESALAEITAEASRRGLNPQEVMQRVRRAEASQIRSKRYLLGGGILAVIGILPAVMPQTRRVEAEVILNNPEDSPLTFQIGGRLARVAPLRSRLYVFERKVTEAPAVRWFRILLRGEGDTTLLVRVTDGGERIRSEALVNVRDRGAYVIGSSGGLRYVVEEWRARDGEEPDRTWTFVAEGEVVDLSAVPTPEGLSVEATWSEGPGPFGPGAPVKGMRRWLRRAR